MKPVPRPSARRPALAALAVPFLLLLAACGGGEDGEGATGRCESPDGFSLVPPEGWVASGSDDAPCSRFHPAGADEGDGDSDRPASIAAYIESEPFAHVAGPPPGGTGRATTAIDGLQAVRIAGPAAGDAGERTARYAIDLGPVQPGSARTLVLDAVAGAGATRAEAVRALDATARSLDAPRGGDGREDVVARVGGAGGYRVIAEGRDAQVCLRIPPRGEPRCARTPASGGVATVAFGEPGGRPLGGVTGPRVAEVVVGFGGGTTRTLPVPVDGADAGAFAADVRVSDVEDLILIDREGEVIGRERPGRPGHPGPPDPVGPGVTGPVEEGGFPATGPTALLREVRLGGHDGFDRIVLEFEGDATPSYRISYLDPPVRQDGNGNRVTVDGSAYLEIRLSPASGVDLLDDDARRTYTGPDRLDPDGASVVRELVRTGDFEAQLAWVAGVRGERPFAATLLEDPARVVVDVFAD